MSTQFTNRQWRLPNNENKDKQSNYSMDFSGTGDKIQTTLTPPLADNSRSISLWFYTSNSSIHNICGYGAASQVSGHNGFDILTYTGNYVGIHLFGTAIIAGGTYNLNAWNHYVITYDGTTLQGYLNGVAVDSNNTEVVNTLSTNDFIIGEGVYTGFNGFSGKLDGVSIFDYALTDGTGGTVNQIAALYGSSSTGIGNPMAISGGGKPVAYYPLGDQDAFNGANYLVPNSSLKDYVFDFDTNRIQVSNQSLGITSEIAISAWVKIPAGSTGGASPNIKQIVSEDTTSGASRNWSLSWRGGGYEDFLFSVFHSDGTSTSIYSNVGDINDGKWHHVVGTWDGTTNANAFKIYVDNVTTSTTSTKTDIRATSNIPTTIGAIPATFNRAFDGNISNVQIWDTNLSSTEIETLYNNGSPIQTLANIPQNSNLQGWWKLDASATYDGSNWTIPDDSTNSNDGTSSGMTQANLLQSDLSFTSGYSPYALDFDAASGEYIDCGNDSSLYPRTGNMSYSAWFNASSISGYQTIFGSAASTSSKGVNINLYGSEVRVFMAVGVGGQWGVNTGGVAGGNGLLTSGLGITTGNWYHITTTLDRVGDGVVYINGNEVLRASMSPNNYSSVDIVSTSSSFIGKIDGNFNGSLSNLSIWNAALTSAQVTEIYSEGIPQNLNNHSAVSSLVSWWQLGSNSSFNTNWTVLDEVAASGNNGTSVNMGEDAIVDGVGSYANGVSSGMSDNIVGDAFGSSANSLSYNMDVLDRTEDTPS